MTELRAQLALIAGALLFIAYVLVTGQQAPGFDTVSIRINTSGEWRVSGGFLPGGRFRAGNYPLRNLIAMAYLRPQINPDFLISGGPEWMDTTRFDIDAKAAAEFPAGPDGPTAPRRVMLQKLLADKFALRVHNEMSERPVFELVMARADGRLGPELRKAAVSCAELVAAAAKAAAPAPPCGVRPGPGSIVSTGAPIASIASLLPRFVNRVVIDRTGLHDTYDLTLAWTPAPGEWIAPPPLNGAGPAAAPADGPSLFSALQEQLGLKLEPARAPVDLLVVDHAELPKDN